MNSDNRLHRATLFHENPPSISAENSHFSRHRETLCLEETTLIKHAFATIPTMTTPQKATKPSVLPTSRAAGICAKAAAGPSTKTRVSPTVSLDKSRFLSSHLSMETRRPHMFPH